MNKKTKNILRILAAFVATMAALGYVVSIGINKKIECDTDKQAAWALQCMDNAISVETTSKKRLLIINRCYNKSEKLYCTKLH